MGQDKISFSHFKLNNFKMYRDDKGIKGGGVPILYMSAMKLNRGLAKHWMLRGMKAVPGAG